MSAGEQPASSHRFASGHILAGRFRIVRLAGRGGMGEVYEAFDQELKETVALKLIRADLTSEPRRIERFKREIRNSRRISHPNVCRVYDLFQTPEGLTFLTMEFVAGETLLHLLRRETKLTPEAALPIARQICAGLSGAHAQGIIHRDLKPGNILIADGQPARVAISDFGLAFDLAPLTDDESTMTIRDGAAMGTPAYMAPEQVDGSQVSPATDIYALGLVLYEMVTGERPFAAGTPISEAARRLTEPPRAPSLHNPELPSLWSAVILRCMARDPAQRFSSATDVIESLEGKRVLAPPTVPGSRRNLIIAGLAAASGLIALVLWPKRAERPEAAERLYRQGMIQLRDGAYLRAVRSFEEASKLAPQDPMPQARLAEAWNELEAPEPAREAALKIALSGSDAQRLNRRDALHLQAIRQTVTRDFPAAIETYREALRVAPSNETEFALIDLGRACERNGSNNEALSHFEEASKVDPLNAWAWLRQAVIHGQSAEYARMSSALDRAEKLYRDADKLEGLTEVYFQRGRFAAQQGRLADARTALERAMNLAQTAGNPFQAVRSAMALSRVTLLEGRPEEAQAQAAKAVAMAEAESLEYAVPTGLLELGYAHSVRREYTEARKCFDEALRLSRRHRDRAREALSLLALGFVNLREPATEDEGARQTAQALVYLKANLYRNDAMLALNNLSRYQRNRGEYAKALEGFEQQAEFARQENDKRQEFLALDGAASVRLRQEEYTHALRRATEAHAAAGAIDDPSLQAFAARRMAEAEWRLGEFAQAEKNLDVAAASPGLAPSVAAIRAEMASARLDFGAAARAVAQWRKLQPNAPPEDAALQHWVLARDAAHTEANRAIDRALAAAALVRDPILRASIELHCAEVLADLGSGDKARRLAQEALPALERAAKRESKYRAHLLLARTDTARRPEHLRNASRAWDELIVRISGAPAFPSRPDLAKLRRLHAGLETSLARPTV
jgi:tetratricopeptide (TPR) repeat protein/tRNA A-37 threonylcarbamoyl transferase component Bud32